MRLLFISFVLLTIFASCSKEKNVRADGSVALKVNGREVAFNNGPEEAFKAHWHKYLPGQFGDSAKYVIDGNDASNPNGVKNVLELLFQTDNLKTGTYVLDRNSGGAQFNTIKIDTAVYVVRAPADQITFNVTSITSDRLSGTFSGTMSPANGGNVSSIIITDGKVMNLKRVF